MTRLPVRSLLGALLALPAPALAQSEGPLVGTPMTILVDTGTATGSGALSTDAFHRKAAGYRAWIPEGPPPGPLDPVFTTAELFGDGVSPPAFRVNAYSIGLDEVLATTPSGGESFVAVPSGAWGAVSFSVSRGTAGRPGSTVAVEAASVDGAGADVFTWMLPGSSLPPSVAPLFSSADAQRAADAPEIDLYDGVSPGEITAFDIYTPLYEVGPPIRPLLADGPRVFFSVHHDDVFPSSGPSPVPAGWFSGSTPSPGTILSTEWDPHVGSWSTPAVFLAFDDLGLDLTDDVDGLAVDLKRCKALFSIAARPGEPADLQLQIAAWSCPPSSGFSSVGGSGGYAGGAGVSTGTYRTDNGDGTSTSVAERAGLEDGGEIDGVCTIDPGDQGGLGSLIYGTPALRLSPLSSLSAQIYRDEPDGGPTVTAVVTNVPTGGTFPLQTLELWLGVPPVGPGPYTLWPFPVFVDSLDGSDPSGTRTVPLVSPSLGVLLGLEVDILWVIRPIIPKPTAVAMRLEI